MTPTTFCRTVIRPATEIDVLPAQRDQLAVPHPGAQRDEDHRAPLTFRGLDEPLGFVEVEEVELRLSRS